MRTTTTFVRSMFVLVYRQYRTVYSELGNERNKKMRTHDVGIPDKEAIIRP